MDSMLTMMDEMKHYGMDGRRMRTASEDLLNAGIAVLAR